MKKHNNKQNHPCSLHRKFLHEFGCESSNFGPERLTQMPPSQLALVIIPSNLGVCSHQSYVNSDEFSHNNILHPSPTSINYTVLDGRHQPLTLWQEHLTNSKIYSNGGPH